MRPALDSRQEDAMLELGTLLRRAHAGELAAAMAYAGHARSVRDAREKAELGSIERDELDHRERVGAMLDALRVRKEWRRERIMFRIGVAIAALCSVSGWLAPMFVAGRLERDNVTEYEDAARFAVLSGHAELAPDLLEMAEVEWDHERYFRGKVESHWLGKLLPLWDASPPREHIRLSFEDFLLMRGYLQSSRGN